MTLRAPLAALLLAVSLAGPLAGLAEGQAPAPSAVDAAVGRGVEWLLARQQLDGTWDQGARPRLGATALIVYSLLKSGVDPRHQAIRLAIEHLEGEPDPGLTYDTALLILALVAHDPKLHGERIQGLVDQLLDWQHGDWGYPDGGDLSNTQYAALGLWAASRTGAEVPVKAWDRLVTATLLYQTRDGGFGYKPERDVGTGSMTAAGVGVLAICAERLELPEKRRRTGKTSRLDKALQSGIDWLAEHFSVAYNPGRGGAHLGYYLYGLERAGALVPTSTFGEHDWYAEGAAFLADNQAPGGHWGQSLGAGHPQTCFALLFLRRATVPQTAEQRQLDGRRSVQTEGTVRITASGDNPLAMWLTGFDPELRPGFEWPGEAGRGPRVARVIWLLDGLQVANLEGDGERPIGHERFAHQVELEEPGAHQVAAEVHVLRPPTQDASGRAIPAAIKVLRSPSLDVHVENACPPWMLENARDRRQNLVPFAGPVASASSSVRGHGPQRAVDGHQGRAWLARGEDQRPTLSLTFDDPPTADVVLLGHARTTPVQQQRWARALEVEVTVNGQEVHRVRMHSDVRRKARLELERPVKVRRLDLTITWRVPGAGGQRAVGLAEVELQLGRDGDRR